MYEYFDFDYECAVFEWDEEKAALNFKKRGIRFETASKIFGCPYYFCPTCDGAGESEV